MDTVWYCVRESVKAVDSSPSRLDFEIPPKFTWPVPDKEQDKRNTDRYLEYLQSFLKQFKNLNVKKSIEPPQLNTTVGVDPHHLNGKADLYVMPIISGLITRNQLAMVVEMKPNKLTPNNLAQALGYVIAANSLFDITGRPAPVGLLSDFIDQWCLIWVGEEGEIFYAEMEQESDGKLKNLTRETALYYIWKHCYNYNQLLQEEHTKKRRADHADWAFDGFKAGSLKKSRYSGPEDNMRDVLETEEEIALYDMTKRLRNTPVLDIPASAETLSFYC